MLATLRRLIIALIVLGLSAGAMAFVTPAAAGQMVMAAEQSQAVGAPCGMMVAMHRADSTGKSRMPCNPITPDGVKKMICLQIVCLSQATLPERADLSVGSAVFTVVKYRVSAFVRSGLTYEPELSPPLAV